MIKNRLTKARRFRELDVAHHGGFKQLVRVVTLQLRQYLGGKIQPPVVHGDKDAGDGKSGIVQLLDRKSVV